MLDYLGLNYTSLFIQLENKRFQTLEIKQCTTVITDSGNMRGINEGTLQRTDFSSGDVFWTMAGVSQVTHNDFTKLGRQR